MQIISDIVGRLDCNPKRGRYNCSYVAAIGVTAARLGWGRDLHIKLPTRLSRVQCFLHFKGRKFFWFSFVQN